MSNDSLKQKTISGLFWQFSQKAVGQVVSFAISVVLARLLMPEEFGVVALAGMFTVLIGIFIDCGYGNALVQKKEADDIDFSTIFWAQTIFASIVYALLFFIAPWLSDIFHTPKLCAVVRVLGLGMILGTFGGIQNVVVTRRMAFKVYFYMTLIGTAFSGGIGIFLAYEGWGVWALVFQGLAATIINTITVFVQVRWIPKLIFSKERFKEIFGISSKFMLSGLIGTAFGQLKGYTIGLKYMPSDLAFYNRGEGVPQIFTRNIDASINSVLFPVFSKLQDDKAAVKSAMRRAMKTSSFLLFPILLGLAAISENLVYILYTEKWAACIPFMQAFCIGECFSIMNTSNLQALRGMGKVNTILKLEIYKKPVMIAILIGTMFISPLAIAIGMCFYSFYTMIINAFPNREYVGYKLEEQIKDVSGALMVAVIMAAVVTSLNWIQINRYLMLVIQIIVGILVYCGLSEILHIESWEYVKSNIAERIKKFKR